MNFIDLPSRTLGASTLCCLLVPTKQLVFAEHSSVPEELRVSKFTLNTFRICSNDDIHQVRLVKVKSGKFAIYHCVDEVIVLFDL